MGRLAALDAVMREAPDQQISLTDPDARSMATSGRGSGVVGYNVQVAVETEHHLIVTHEVINIGNDRAQLAPMAKAAKETLQAETLDVIADRGYFDGEQIRECVEAGVTVTLPKPLTSGAKADGRFGKQDFAYLSEQDAYRCPAGADPALSLQQRRERHGAAPVLVDSRVRGLPDQAAAARRPRSDVIIAVGARASGRGRPAAAGRQSRGHAHAARDGRAPLRHDQGPDGRDPLPNEAPAQRRRRDGTARSRLQPDPGDEHRRPTALIAAIRAA